MKNCLVTKLKEVVNNDNLLKVGEFEVGAFKNPESNEVNLQVRLESSSPTPMRIVGNGTFSNGEKTYTHPADNYNTVVVTNPDENTKVYVNNSSYHLYKFMIAYNSIDLSIFKYHNIVNLESYDIKYKLTGDVSVFKDNKTVQVLSLINTKFSKVSGDISSFSNCTSLSTLSLRDCPITGDVSVLAPLLNITNLDVWSTNVSGSIEGFVAARRAAQIAAGQEATGSMVFCAYSLNSPYLTWKGEPAQGVNPSSESLSWTPTTITWKGETINA